MANNLTPYQKVNVVNAEGTIITSFGSGADGGGADMAETNNRLGAKTEAAAASDVGTSGLNGLLKRLLQKLVTTASGIKVDGSAVTQPVSGIVDVANFPTTQAIAASTLPLPNGAASNAMLAEVRDRVPASAIGSPSEVPPASDTGYAGINGRLQRIAQRISSLVGLLPSSLSNGRFQTESVIRKLVAADDEVRSHPVYESSASVVAITSSNTAYVRSQAVDLRGFNRIAIFPNVVVSGGSTGYYKVSWSADGTNWFDETVDDLATPNGGEILVSQYSALRQFPSNATGFKSLSAATFDKRCRYLSISQRSDSNVTLTTNYNYQLS